MDKNYLKKSIEPKEPEKKPEEVIVSRVELERVNQTINKLSSKIDKNKEEFAKVGEELKELKKKAEKVQQVEVTNPIEVPKMPEKFTVKVENFPETPKPVAIQKVEVVNQTPKDELPIGEGFDTPGKSDPTRYINVRLTNGKRFYQAIDGMMSAAGTGGPLGGGGGGTSSQVSVINVPHVIVDSQPAQTFSLTGTTAISGTLNGTTAVSGTMTAASGTFNTHLDNFPTVQTVNVQNTPPVTSVSGTFHALVDNFPTVQEVFVTNPQSSTITSGTSNINIGNFPTTQQVWVVNQQSSTIASGTSNINIGNYPTIQTVNVQNQPPVTATSGTFYSNVANFPTIQTVNVQNMPVTVVSGTTNIGTITTYSGTGIPFFDRRFNVVVPVEASYTAAQTDTAHITCTASQRIVVDGYQISLSAATTVQPQIRVGFGTANTPTTTGVIFSHSAAPAGGSWQETDLCLRGNPGEDVRVTCAVPTTGEWRVVIRATIIPA